MMTWIKKAKKIHSCRMPILWPWIRVGSEWQCDACGQIYILQLERFGIHDAPVKTMKLVRTAGGFEQ